MTTRETSFKIKVIGLIGIALVLGFDKADKFEIEDAEHLIVRNNAGMQLSVVEENADPTLRVVLPGQPTSDRSIEVLFPEHVTIRPAGVAEGHQIFMFQGIRSGVRPPWRKSGNYLEYEKDFPGTGHLLARATLEEDGVRFHLKFSNTSKKNYDLVYMPIDPRLTGNFHDERLERTYVHHKDGFDLLASETPERLTMSLNQWLPVRYLDSYTWPIPTKRIERRDGITYYNKSRPVDMPFIATQSKDRRWVVASFTRNTGNVWSNPELTCQHVDPQASIAPSEEAVLEAKVLFVRGSLDDAFKLALQQRGSLKP